ncbi:MAG: hypothetical protein B7Z80_07475 [Rhodospirillales bacterium 20-64-7]|nr:MAG: hypothetical protein B7Z80_07475 [Rhodospirillales bacterium 20-64-7]
MRQRLGKISGAGGVARLGLAGLTAMGLAACSMGGSHQSTNMATPPARLATPAAPPTAPVAQVTIRDVQTALQKAGYYKRASTDGVWGRMTEHAVQRFQHDHNLTANGKLDVPTLQALNLTGAPPSTSTADDTMNNTNTGTNANTGNSAGNNASDANPAMNNPPPASDSLSNNPNPGPAHGNANMGNANMGNGSSGNGNGGNGSTGQPEPAH